MGENGKSDEVPKVDNPYRTHLVRLKQNLQEELKDLKELLKTTAKRVGEGKAEEDKAWVGKTADKWHSDIAARRTHMVQLLEKLIPAVQAKIDETPEKVPIADAKLIQLDLRGY
ncbi:hypothetical protein [Streptomyces sp. XD-27]|uniref:hypothetical protein n=1 Tax=Streptomyces sp. XD-27 TaxID=3062779 RepID=UPI0026F45AA7|nr:hypothetical protein [Streptomyces sp. XD-27]WKX70969.1 hypothetical protein Q3Y56_14570 [Streptomyces sp. XD-27]